MIGICPNCKIKLKEPPLNNRDTNEVMLVLKYRNLIEEGIKLKPLVELGYCELCNATNEDIEEQNKLIFSLKKK
jgi:hypothetical protein